MSLSDFIFAKQRLEQLLQIWERRELTPAEKDEYEKLTMKVARNR
jgi:hypothetical protein